MAFLVQHLLAANIKRMRRARRISQKTLADRCGFSDTHVADIEGARKFPSAAKLQALADGLACHPADLFAPIADEVREDPYAEEDLIASLQKSVRTMERTIDFLANR